jgi:hypothetical protein
MKTGKTMMPHLEMCNDVNAWDAAMQEAARDYDPFRALPNVPEARADHTKRVGSLREGCGRSLAQPKRQGDGQEVSDLRRWANEYVTEPQEHRQEMNGNWGRTGKGWDQMDGMDGFYGMDGLY